MSAAVAIPEVVRATKAVCAILMTLYEYSVDYDANIWNLELKPEHFAHFMKTI